MAFYLSWACVILGCLSASSAGTSNLSDVYPHPWKESPGQFSDYRVENEKYVIDDWAYLEKLGMYKILLNKTTRHFTRFAPENKQNILWGSPLQHGWKYHSGASNLSDLYPPLWEESPGQFSDYRMKDGQYIIDAWIYPERMGMYKILMNQTARYFEKFAAENEQNILWGLSLHHGWQYHTDLNYFLSAIPFLAAIDSGIMGLSPDKIILLPPSKDQMKFCYNVSSCRSSFPTAMKKWNEFYQHVKSPSSSFDDLLKYLWAAHVSCLDVARKSFHSRLKYYPKPEADFERSWALFVDYLSPTLFPTTLIEVYEFQKGQPPRMLVAGDRAPFISDFTNFQNIVLLGVNFLHKVHKFTGTSSFTVWKTLMKIKVARKLFLHILEFILHAFNASGKL